MEARSIAHKRKNAYKVRCFTIGGLAEVCILQYSTTHHMNAAMRTI